MLRDSLSVAAVVIALGSVFAGKAPVQDFNYVPPKGYVPDADTAASVAAAVLVPVYGKEEIGRQTPFKVTLVKDAWIVEGTIKSVPGTIFVGGTALVKISKKTGAILRMTHGM